MYLDKVFTLFDKMFRRFENTMFRLLKKGVRRFGKNRSWE
jgi:hypothetical protein